MERATGFEPSPSEQTAVPQSLSIKDSRLSFLPLEAEAFPTHHVSGTVSVNQLISREIVFGDLRAFPPLDEILVEQRVQAEFILVVAKHIFRHGMGIPTRVIMLEPHVVP